MMDYANFNLDEVLEPACSMVARGAIPAITVVPGVPLDDDRLQSLEAYAVAQGVSLSIDETGVIHLRGGAPTFSGPRTFEWRRLLLWRSSFHLPAGAFTHPGNAR